MSAADAIGGSATDEIERVARAFSGHRFRDAYERIAPDARWVIRGGPTHVGRAAIIAACEGTLVMLEGGAGEFLGFVVVADHRGAAVDAVRPVPRR